MGKGNIKTNSTRAGKILKRLTADKKKGVMALGLVAVMVIMWLRIFTHNQPSAAQATPSQVQPQNEPAALKVTFIELPVVPGRNDLITRDFLNAQGWKSFSKYREGQSANNAQEVTIVSSDHGSDVLAQVAQKVKLEAILLSKRQRPQAYINDKLLSVGGSFTVKDGAKTYQFEVTGIFDNIVLLKHDNTEITLKLTQNTETVNQ